MQKTAWATIATLLVAALTLLAGQRATTGETLSDLDADLHRALGGAAPASVHSPESSVLRVAPNPITAGRSRRVATRSRTTAPTTATAPTGYKLDDPSYVSSPSLDPPSLDPLSLDPPSLDPLSLDPPLLDPSTGEPPFGPPQPVPADGDGAASPFALPGGLGEFQPPFGLAAPTFSSESWLRNGHWYVQEEWTMLLRLPSHRLILSVDSDLNATIVNPGNFARLFINGVRLTTDTKHFGFEPGARLTLGNIIGRDLNNRDNALEFTFLGLNEWTTAASVSAAGLSIVGDNLLLFSFPDPGVGRVVSGNVVVDPTIPAFNFSDVQGYTYAADFNSFEMNLRILDRLRRDRMVYSPDGCWTRHATPTRTISYVAGFRHVALDEDFLYFSNGVVRDAAGDPVLDGTGDTSPALGRFTINTENDLFGVQGGVDFTEQHASWSFGARSKFGLYTNFAQQMSTVVTTPSDPLVERMRIAKGEQLSVMIELGLVTTYQVRPNLAFRAAYDAIFIQGVALAPEQLSFNRAAPERIDTGGWALMHGASVGIEATW